MAELYRICAECKKINHEGRWISGGNDYNRIIEEERRSDVPRFTHGFCKPCAEKLYPEYLEEDKK